MKKMAEEKSSGFIRKVELEGSSEDKVASNILGTKRVSEKKEKKTDKKTQGIIFIVLVALVVSCLMWWPPGKTNEQISSSVEQFRGQIVEREGTPAIIKAIFFCGNDNNVEIEKYRKCVEKELTAMNVSLSDHVKDSLLRDWISYCDSLEEITGESGIKISKEQKDFCYLQGMITLGIDKIEEYNITGEDNVNWFKMAYYNDTEYCNNIKDTELQKLCHLN